jgi:sugar O-acyltransferase (sialic acid O-acetyltransferase NeuD family)
LIELKVPKLGVNDDELLLATINVARDQYVKKDDLLVIFESMKTSVEFSADSEGFFEALYKEGEKIKVGNVFGFLKSSLNESIDYNVTKTISNEINMTKKARDLFEASDLTIDNLPKGKLIKTEDIIKIINTKKDSKNEYSLDDGISYFKEKFLENDIVLIGGRGLISDYIESLLAQKIYNVIGILHSEYQVGTMVESIPVIGKNDDFIYEKLKNNGLKNIIVTFGALNNRNIRIKEYEKLSKFGFEFPKIIHPNASISNTAKIGKGVMINSNASIGSNVIIEDYSIILDNSVVSHDSYLMRNSYIAPGAILAGYVSVGYNSVIGLGVTVYSNVSVGNDVIIQNGANVFTDVNDSKIVK